MGPVSNPQEVGFQREQEGGSSISIPWFQGPEGPCFSLHRACLPSEHRKENTLAESFQDCRGSLVWLLFCSFEAAFYPELGVQYANQRRYWCVCSPGCEEEVCTNSWTQVLSTFLGQRGERGCVLTRTWIPCFVWFCFRNERGKEIQREGKKGGEGRGEIWYFFFTKLIQETSLIFQGGERKQSQMNCLAEFSA